jgi:hypothetical protein
MFTAQVSVPTQQARRSNVRMNLEVAKPPKPSNQIAKNFKIERVASCNRIAWDKQEP